MAVSGTDLNSGEDRGGGLFTFAEDRGLVSTLGGRVKDTRRLLGRFEGE